MTKITDTQVAVLASAAIHVAGIAIRPDKLKAATAAKVATSLIGRQYMREVQARAGWPVWRKDDVGRTYSLKILRAGKAALFAAQPVGTREQPAYASKAEPIVVAPAEIAPRKTSKIGGIVAMLERSGGATACEMIAATGWKPHTLRAALTGLRKRGYDVERIYNVEAAPAYRIGPGAAPAEA